jgi:hypothetical protein
MQKADNTVLLKVGQVSTPDGARFIKKHLSLFAFSLGQKMGSVRFLKVRLNKKMNKENFALKWCMKFNYVIEFEIDNHLVIEI